MAGNILAAFAYVADIMTRETRAEGMSEIGAAFALGFTIGPAIRGGIDGSDPVNADFQTPAFIAIIISDCALIFGNFENKKSLSKKFRQRIVDRPRDTRAKQFKLPLKKTKYPIFIAIIFSCSLCIYRHRSDFRTLIPSSVWLGTRIKWLFICSHRFIQCLIARRINWVYVKRFGEAYLILHRAVALAIGIGLIPMATEIWMVIVMLIAVYGFSLISSSINSLISFQIGEKDQDVMMGVARSATTLARVGGPA